MSDDFRMLRDLEESLWRAETRFDPQVMEQTFAMACHEIGRSGRCYDRADLLISEEGGAQFAAELPLTDYTVEYVAPDVALATYSSVVRYGTRVEKARRSSLWIKEGGCWRLRFHQGTPLG